MIFPLIRAGEDQQSGDKGEKPPRGAPDLGRTAERGYRFRTRRGGHVESRGPALGVADWLISLENPMASDIDFVKSFSRLAPVIHRGAIVEGPDPGATL